MIRKIRVALSAVSIALLISAPVLHAQMGGDGDGGMGGGTGNGGMGGTGGGSGGGGAGAGGNSGGRGGMGQGRGGGNAAFDVQGGVGSRGSQTSRRVAPHTFSGSGWECPSPCRGR